MGIKSLRKINKNVVQNSLNKMWSKIVQNKTKEKLQMTGKMGMSTSWLRISQKEKKHHSLVQ